MDGTIIVARLSTYLAVHAANLLPPMRPIFFVPTIRSIFLAPNTPQISSVALIAPLAALSMRTNLAAQSLCVSNIIESDWFPCET